MKSSARPAALALALLWASVARGADQPFVVGAPFAGRALFGCSDVTLVEAQVGSDGVSTWSAKQGLGHVASNGDILLAGRTTVQGDVTAGPGRQATVAPESKVTGSTTPARDAVDCRPVDLAAFNPFLQANDDARIPKTAAGHDAVKDGALVLDGPDPLTLPPGTYVFSSIALSNRAHVILSGETHVFVIGDVSLTGNSHLNPAGGGFRLRLVAGGARFRLDTLSTLGAFVYAPNAEAILAGGSHLAGSLFAGSILVREASVGTRAVDDTPPLLDLSEPVTDAAVSLNAVHVRGTVRDPETVVSSVTVNGAAVPVAADGGFELTVDATATLEVRADATNVMGLTSTVRRPLCSGAPAVAIASPANGSIVGARTGSVYGTCGSASTVAVNGKPATVSNGTFRADGVDFGPDGVATVTVIASNACARTAAVSAFIVDTTAPVVTIDSPAPGTVFGASPIAVSGTFVEANLDSITVNGVAATISGSRFTAGAVPIPAGPSTLVALAHDRAGRTGESGPVSVSLDVAAPTVRITSPASGFLTGGARVTVTGVAEVPNLAGVRVAGIPATLSGTAFTVANVPLVEGDNRLVAEAVDVASRTFLSAPVVVTLDTLPPTVTLDTGGLPALTGETTLSVSGTVSDPHLAGVTVNGAPAVVSGGRFAAAAVPLAEGDNVLTAHATDSLGHAADSNTFTVNRDTQAPLVAITSPAPNAQLVVSSVTVAGTVSDAHLSGVTVNGVAAAVSGGGFTATLTLPEGDTTIVARGVDAVGNVGTSPGVAVTVDTLAPVVAIDPPADTVSGSPLVTVTGTILEPHLLSITVSGVPAFVTGGKWVATNVPLVEGSQEITAVAVDTFGHRATSAPVTFRLDSTPPTLTMDAPAADSAACRAPGGPVTVSGRVFSRVPKPVVTLAVQPAGGAAKNLTATLDAAGTRWSVPNVDLGASDGTATLTAATTDALGHDVRVLRSFRIKASSPSIALLLDGGPMPGAAAGAAAGAGETPVLFGRALVPRAAVTDGPASAPPAPVLTLDGAPWSGSPIGAEGTHLFVASATDCAGHAASAHALFTIDVTPPRLLTTAPADGAALGSSVSTISGTSDPDLAFASVNGAPATVSGSAFSLSPFSSKEGTNALVIVLADRAGNRATFARSFNVKSLGPSVEILESGAPLGTGAVFFRAVTPVVRSNDATATVKATLNGATFTSGTPVSASGDYALSATATDSFGHMGSATASFRVDLTPGPALDITAPADRAVLPGPTVAVAGTASASVTSVTVNGRAATLTGTTWSLPDLVLPPDVPSEIVAIGADAAGRTASATRQVTVRASGPQITILDPADGSRTNRKKIDVAGAVLGGPSATANGTVTVAGATLSLDALGTFRAKDVPLVSGANTITASATDSFGRTGTAAVTVTTDTTAPAIAIAADGQPLVDGASFARPFTLRVTVTDDSVPPPVPTIRLNGLDQGATAAVTDLPITKAGGYTLSVVARDAAGNESRADRSFVVASGGCAISALDPADGAIVAAPRITLKGRSGDAASVTVASAGQTFAARLADGTFAAGDVPLPLVGDNTLTVACTDRAGTTSTVNLKITRLPDGAGPVVKITQPSSGAKQTAGSVAVSGTVSDAAAAVTVNGVRASVSGGTFAVPPMPLAEGPNVLAARAVDAAGRAGEDRVVVFRDSTAPKILITSPPDGAHVGSPGSAAATVNVSGIVDLTLEPDLASVVVAAAAGSITATVDGDTGAFYAGGVPLSTASPGFPQTVTATATDALGQSASASIKVVWDPSAPALLLAQPVDGTRFTETSPPSFAASGEAWAKDGAIVSINGGGLDGVTWDAPAADGRRHATFSAQVTVPAAEGPFGVLARVDEPSGAYANDKRVLFKDSTAPTVLDMQPADGAAQVDANEILLVLFSEPVKLSSLATSDGLTVTRLSTGDKIVGAFTIAGNAVAFTPGAAMARGESYRFRAGPGITDLAGHPLAAAKESRFTIATLGTSVPPTLDPLPPVVCATQLAVTGSAAPGSTVRVRDGNLSFTGGADATGRFTVTIPLSGNGWHVLHAAVVDRDGSAGPEVTALFRVDCSAPTAVGATFDRTAGRITVSFSEAMNPASLTVGGSGSAIRVSKADDPTNAPQSATLSLSTDGATATLDVGNSPSSWWVNASVRLTVGAPAADAAGNVMAAPFTTVFFAGGGGDPSGGFLSGMALDDDSGRPLAGADAKLYTSDARLPGSVPAAQVTPPTASTVTDGRGRYSLTGDIAAGRYALVLSRTGYTRALRRLALEPSVGAVPFGVRLTPLAPQAPALLVAASGGSFVGPAGSNASVDVAPNAVPSAASLGVILTPLSAQGLPEPLPLGFTALAAAELRLIPNGAGDDALPEGAGTPFAPGGVVLSLPLPAGINPADLYAARYDVVAGAWLALPLPVFVAGTTTVPDRARVALSGPGTVAIVAPDADPATRPPVLPVSLDAPLVGADPPSTSPTLTATIALDPAIVSPTGRATARVVAKSADGTTPWPSGLAVQAYLDEKLILAGGAGELYEAPFSADLVLYHSPPLSPADLGGAAPGAAGALTFRVSPSPRAAQVLLDTGFENVHVYPFTDQLERGQVLGPAGGSVSTSDGVELVVPESGLAQKTVVTARKLTATELAGLPPVAGYTTVAAVRVSLSGATLARPATLRLTAPAGLPTDAADDPRLVLATFVDQPDDGRGAFANAIARVTLLPAAGAVPAKLVAAPESSGSTLPFPGLLGEGLFVFLHASAPIGFATGRVTAPNGAGIAGSRVTAAGLGTANLSVPGGTYALPAPAGAATLTALHPVLPLSATGQVPALAKGQIATLDLVLTPVPPQIRSFQPANGAVDQPVGTAVALVFSAALDPTTITPATLTVSLADASGAPTGLLFSGSLVLSPDKTTVVFTPARPLPPGKRIAARFAGGVRDLQGTLYGGPLPVDWSFTTSTQFVTGGAIHPEKIRLLVPVNGIAQIIGADGTLPLVTGGTPPWSVWADVEGVACPTRVTQPANGTGGFTLTAGCPPTNTVTFASKIWLHVIDPTGTEAATFKLGPFSTPDGKGFVATPGDDLVFTTAEGVEVTAPAAAFDAPTLVTVTKQPLDSLAVALNPGLEMGAVLKVDFDGTAKETLRVRIPVTTSAPVGGLVFAGTPIDLPWGRKLQILDIGRLVDDGKGGKLISTLEADQPADPELTAGATSGPSGRTTLVSKKLLRTITAELTARATVGYVWGATLPLVGVTGATVSTTLFILYNAIADSFIFQALANDWSGRFILPAFPGQTFSVVKRDVSTGWILARQDYPGPAATGGLTSLGTFDPGPNTPPMLVDASPIRVLRFAAPPVDPVRATDTLRLALEAEAVVGYDRRASLRSVSGFPFPDGTSVELFNFTQATATEPSSGVFWSRAFVASGGSFTTSDVAAAPADDMLAFVSPGDLDPAGVADLSFTFSRGITSPPDPASLVELTDCGPRPTSFAGGVPPCTIPSKVSLTAELLPSGTTLLVHLPGRLAHGRQYRVELKGITSNPANVPYPPLAPATFFFATRAVGDPLGKLSNSALGDTNSARDLIKFGNLLLVGSATGHLVSVDVTDPAAMRRVAALVSDPGSDGTTGWIAAPLRAFATDGHGRLFYNVQFGASWAVKAVRIEDVRAHSTPCPSTPAPFDAATGCFAAVSGGVRTAFAPGTTSGLTGSDFLSLIGSLPTGTPSSMEIVVRDDLVPPAVDDPYEFRELYELINGTDAFDKLPKQPDGFYEYDVPIDTTGHRAARPSSCGEETWDHYQRVSIDNLATGHAWSQDVENPWQGTGGSGKAKIHVRGRPGDHLRIRYNVLALGYVSIVGSGITVLDLNRFYRTTTPAVPTQFDKSECNRRLGRFEGQDVPLYGVCPPPANATDASNAPKLDGISNTPALAAVPTDTDVHVYSVLTHYGLVHSAASNARPADLAVTFASGPLAPWETPDGATCLKTRAPVGLFPSYRAIALARDAAYTDFGIVADGGSGFSATGREPEETTGDLLFVSLGSAGVLSYAADDGSGALRLIGRYWFAGHSVYRLQADVAHGLLFAGGQDGSGNSIVDVWDLARANGGPTPDGVFPPAAGAAVDPRLLATLAIPWDTNHIGLDDAGTGIVFTWGSRITGASPGKPGSLEEGGFAASFDAPSFTFAGVYRATKTLPTGATIPSVVWPSTSFDPLGVPLRLSPKDESDNAPTDEFCAGPESSSATGCHTAAFKVRVAIPGGAAGGAGGSVLAARVQSLRALPDRSLLAKDDLGPLVALCGGAAPCDGKPHASESGWPDRDVYVTLRRIGKPGTGPDGAATNPYDLYESDETVLLLADPRARFEYWKPYQAQPLKPTPAPDERHQCRRCDRPGTLPQDANDKSVLELLAGGPYVRVLLAPNPDPAADPSANGATSTVLAWYDRAKLPPPAGWARVSGFADAVPSPIQLALAEPAQNPAVLAAEAGASVRLRSGEGVVETRDFSAAARTLGFAFDRTYRSGVLGYGPLGAAGWSASLFAHVREIPLAGLTNGETYVDFHDGAGQVFRFVWIPKEQTCPRGTERDTSETYCAPVGLYLKLENLAGGGFKLVGRNHDSLLFDSAGRLTLVADQHVLKDGQGSSVRLFYSPAGDLARVEDEMGRVYRFTYFDDPALGESFGLLKRIDDFASPVRTVKFDYDLRRLSKVTLPGFTNTEIPDRSDAGPAISYAYLKNQELDAGAPAHGPGFSKLKVESFTNPGGDLRMVFTWDPRNGHARLLKPPPINGWLVDYKETTADPVTGVNVTTPSGMAAVYELDVDGRVLTRTRTFEVSRASTTAPPGPPADTGVVETATYKSDGRLETFTRGDGGTTTYGYGPDSPRLNRLNATSIDDSGRKAVPTFEDNNFLTNLKDPLGRDIKSAVAPPDVSTGLAEAPSGFTTDGVNATTVFDKFGRVGTFYDGGKGAPNVTTTIEYDKDALGRSNAGFAKKVTQGPLWEKYENDERGNPTHVDTSFGSSDDVVYDEWDRPVKLTLGQASGGSGSVSGVGEIVRRGYDAAGRLVVEIRTQKTAGGSQADVRTEFDYDLRDQVTRIRRFRIASSDPGALLGPGAYAETKLDYDSRGFLKTVTSPAGIVTTYDFDKAGRLKSVTPPLSGTRTFGYDEMGRPTYATDGDNGVWTGAYDSWGGLLREDLPTGGTLDRTFDDAGGLLTARLRDRSTGQVLSGVHDVSVTSFGEATSLVRDMGTIARPETLTVSRSFDSSGRFVQQTSADHTDLKLDYEPGTGRVNAVSDAANQLKLGYTGASGAPWPSDLTFGEMQTGASPGAFTPTASVQIFGRDAYGRVTQESRSDGSVGSYDFDEVGRPLSIVDGASATALAWDSRGSLLSLARPGPQGATTYGYDLDGRLLKKHSVAGTSGQAFDTSYTYESGSGRLRQVSRPDGATETYTYNNDDTIATVARSDGATLTYSYDEANRIRKRVATGGSVIPGGETFTWDAASRVTGAARLKPNGTDVDAASAVVPGDYDFAGRPRSETVGARPPLTRTYDLLGGVTGLGLPVGVGANGKLAYTRTFEPGTHRLSSLTASGDAPPAGGIPLASLGASWAWLGADRLLGVTTSGPARTAHRFGYVGGPGGPDGSVPGAAKWKLGTLTVGTAGTSDPFKDAGVPLGDPAAAGSAPWGQFLYGYSSSTAGDGTKLGRRVTGVGLTGLLAGSLLSNQGFAYGLDPAKRLTSAYAGPGDERGVDKGGAAAAIAAFERFRYEYGQADQLTKETREVSTESVGYTTGGDGRPDVRTAEPDGTPPGPSVTFTYDGMKRRTADDRFTYVWHYDGKLAEAVVKTCWPIDAGESQSPACPAGFTTPAQADHNLVFTYDALSRPLTRTHLGPIPDGKTDAERPFIETREYLFDGNTLLSEVGKAQDGAIRWRKTYVPGTDLHDHVQLRVETYDAAQNLASDRLYAYVRDEQGTVLALVDETSDPKKPSIPIRYLYTPYGNAHAETGPEIRKASYVFGLTSVRDALGTTKAQDATGAMPGGVRVRFGIDVDVSTAAAGIVFERRAADGTWGALTAADLAIARASDATNAEIDVLPLRGFAFATTYRVRTTSGLKDLFGRNLPDPKVLELPQTPAAIPPDQIGSTTYEYERAFPLFYDSVEAAGADANGLFPGGQPMGFQGHYTDPLLGFLVTPNRIYDARNASWLSPDPMEDRDSPNLYGFAGMTPHTGTDPLGLQTTDPDEVDVLQPVVDSRNHMDRARRRAREFGAAGAMALDLGSYFIPGFGTVRLTGDMIGMIERGEYATAAAVVGGGWLTVRTLRYLRAAAPRLWRRLAQGERLTGAEAGEIEAVLKARPSSPASQLTRELDEGAAGTQRAAGEAAGAPKAIGTQDPYTAWAAKTGRAYDRRVKRMWRKFEHQTIGDWYVLSVDRRLAPGVQPDLVLVNKASKTVVIHDLTSVPTAEHLAKGASYKRALAKEFPGYTIEYKEGYWSGLEDFWEALSKEGELYLPSLTKPSR